MQFVADLRNRTRLYTKITRQNMTGEDCLHRLYAAHKLFRLRYYFTQCCEVPKSPKQASTAKRTAE